VSRGITQAVIDELSSGSFNMAALVHIDFATPVYLTDYHHNLPYGGDTYGVSGHLLDIGNVSESHELDVGEIDITFSGKDQSYIALLLSENYVGRDVNITNVVVSDAGAVIGHCGEYKGTVSGFAIQGDNVLLTVTSHWADFERVTGRRSNDNSQQSHYPGDTSASRCSQIVKDIKWGRS